MLADLSARIHQANIVTACQFCNSTTSRDRSPFTMEEVIAVLPDDPEDALRAVAETLQQMLDGAARGTEPGLRLRGG
jgi:hypothetical protein